MNLVTVVSALQILLLGGCLGTGVGVVARPTIWNRSLTASFSKGRLGQQTFSLKVMLLAYGLGMALPVCINWMGSAIGVVHSEPKAGSSPAVLWIYILMALPCGAASSSFIAYVVARARWLRNLRGVYAPREFVSFIAVWTGAGFAQGALLMAGYSVEWMSLGGSAASVVAVVAGRIAIRERKPVSQVAMSAHVGDALGPSGPVSK